MNRTTTVTKCCTNKFNMADFLVELVSVSKRLVL